MQLLISTLAIKGFGVGDIIAVVPGVHVWGREEVMALWLGDGNDAADFPNPHFAVVQMPSEPCDLNLAGPALAVDPDDPDGHVVIARHLWYLDLADLPVGPRNSLLQPGGQAQIGRNRRSAIKNRLDGSSLPPGAADDGNTKHRHPGTDPRVWVTPPAVRGRGRDDRRN